MTTSKSKALAKAAEKSASRYRLMFLPEALDEFRALDGSVRANVKKLLEKRLNEPHVPGSELHGDLANCYKIKLLRQGIRLVYRVENEKLIILVLAVDKREDNLAYTSAVGRLMDAAKNLSMATARKISKK